MKSPRIRITKRDYDALLRNYQTQGALMGTLKKQLESAQLDAKALRERAAEEIERNGVFREQNERLASRLDALLSALTLVHARVRLEQDERRLIETKDQVRRLRGGAGVAHTTDEMDGESAS